MYTNMFIFLHNLKNHILEEKIIFRFKNHQKYDEIINAELTLIFS